MKARELVEALSALDPELEIIIGKDREGNDHSPCDGLQLGTYTPVTTWHGEWASIDHPVDEGGTTEDKVNAVVLFPVN